jgi:hypothetical protein
LPVGWLVALMVPALAVPIAELEVEMRAIERVERFGAELQMDTLMGSRKAVHRKIEGIVPVR